MTESCRVPMWMGGMPAGLCMKRAYGRPHKNAYHNWVLFACPQHGGPKLKDVAHECDPCKCCGTAHDDVAPGPCPEKKEVGDE